MGIPSAECPKCGSQHHGWALLNPRHQSCSHCGASLKITVDRKTFEGYSPFKAEHLIIKKRVAGEPPPPTAKQKRPQK